MKRSLVAWVIIAVLSVLGTTGCIGSFLAGRSSAAYEAASATYQRDTVTFDTARKNFVKHREEGTVGQTQWDRFTTAEGVVRATDTVVYDDLKAWATNFKKPSGFDDHYKALVTAQNKIIALSLEVQ